jgi:hypothetical protein
LLNRNFGELTSREDLIQQVWINEGVITGRSLDMFVSKLRKKLSKSIFGEQRARFHQSPLQATLMGNNSVVMTFILRWC